MAPASSLGALSPARLAPQTFRAPGEGRVQLLLTGLWGWAVVPRVIQSLTAPKHRRSVGIDYGGYTAAATLAQDVFRFAIVAICAILIVDSLRRDRHIPLHPLLFFLAPWIFLAIRDLYASENVSIDALLFPVVALALWASRPSVSCLRILAHLTTLAVVISASMAVLDPPSALFRSSEGALILEDKQIFPSGMLAGFLTQPNNLGQFIVLGAPALFLLRQRWLRVAYWTLYTFAIIWTASRTSMYAIVIICIAAGLLGVAGRGRARCGLAFGVIAVPFIAVCALPLITSDPSAFSERGFIWQASLPAWYENIWFGQGANWYRDIASTSDSIASSAFQGHNQLVQLLVTGGFVYAALTALMIAKAAGIAIRLAESGEIYGVMYLVALAGTCLLEVSLVTVDNSSMFPVVVVPLAIVLFSRPAVSGSSQHRSAMTSSPRSMPATQRCESTSGRAPGIQLPRIFVARDSHRSENDPEAI